MNKGKKILVCGAGTMGAGIAQAAIQHHITTWLYDRDEQALREGVTQIQHFLRRAVEKGRITETQKRESLDLLHPVGVIHEAEPQIVIEAIVEDIDAKISLFNTLANTFPPEIILATNTSSLSVSRIAQAVPHGEGVIGMHFFNPVPLMKLVEIVKTNQTAPSVVATVRELAAAMNKTAVVLQDTPGFIVNRVARPFYLESFRLAEDGVADISTIDRLMQGLGFKMGPFALTDLIGQDINLAVTRSLFQAFGFEPRYRPSPLQVAKVQAGLLGRKSGQGFYEYK